ncbi:MAG TPA: M1 family aminopeptidase [Blastocatellia bacterium]|nr:M1 family aminopeptidase [Blastocatellia bacterium]
MSSKAPLPDPLIHPALLDPRQWGEVDLYNSLLKIEREEIPGDERHAPDRSFRIHHLKLELRFDLPDQSVQGAATLTISPFAGGLQSIELDAAELNVSSVRRIPPQAEPDDSPLMMIGATAVNLSFDTRAERLSIELDQALERDEEVMIEIAYSCRPRKGLFFVQPDEAYPQKPYQIWSQGQTEDAHWWFPCADTPHQKMTTELLATVDEKYFALSNGALVGSTGNQANGTITYHWRQEQPHPAYLITVVIGEYELLQQRLQGLPVEYYVYADRAEQGHKLFQRTPEMLEFFAEKFGYPYPFAKYAQILVDDFLFGAMENTSATTMTDRCLLDARAELDLNYEDIVAHELAHHWWGDLVTCKHWTEIWLNESFATYSEYLWREHTRGSDEARFVLFQDFLTYLNEDCSSHRRPILFHRYRYSEELMDRHAYEKGACVLHMLRHVLGDEAFFRSMGRYLRKFAFGVAETNDLKTAIEEVTGRNLHWFFDQWIYGAGYPELEIAYEWQREQKMLRLSVKQVQKADEDDEVVEAFRFPVEIEIVTAEHEAIIEADRHTSFHVWVEKAEQEFYFPCETKPRMVVFDKGHRVFKLLRFPKSQQELRYQLEHDEDMLGCARAARELSAYKTDDTQQALQAVLRGNDFRAVRMAAAISLGELNSDDARRALREAYITCTDSHVRRTVVWALGSDTKATESLLQFLREVIANDPSYFVQAAAVRALGHLSAKAEGNAVYDAINTALAHGSWQEAVRASVFHTFKYAKEKRAVDLAIKHSQYGEPIAVRVAAIGALGAIGKELHKDKADDKIVDHLLELLEDKAIRARVAAVRALGKVGNDHALPALQAAQTRECLDQIKAALADAIEGIQKK